MSVSAGPNKGKDDRHDDFPTNKGDIVYMDLTIPDHEIGQRLYPDPINEGMSDPLLSLKAKGLLALLSWWQMSNMDLPLPPLSEIRTMSNNGADATRSAMSELIGEGYAVRRRVGLVVQTFLTRVISDYDRANRK